MEVIGNQSQAQLNPETSLNPLCKQQQECAGWGADVVKPPPPPPADFLVVQLSYTDPSKAFEGIRGGGGASDAHHLSTIFN
jgi:hypothetical protein